VQIAYLDEDHGGDLLSGELLGLTEVGNLDHGGATLVDDLEGPWLDVLGDGLVLESATNEAPVEVSIWCLVVARKFCKTYLTSKTVFSGFIAAWFLAASPMRRSSLVKETKEGVVKEPCSLATTRLSLKYVHGVRWTGGRILISTLVPS
jgi:hypothetical protein